MQNSSYDLALHSVIGKSGGSPSPSGYIRPSEWPSISSLIATNKIVGIYAIDKGVSDSDGVPVAFSVTCPSGTFTVDWGDGTSSTSNASGTKVTKTYIPSNTTGVTDTSYGYKCAIIQITATTNITSCNFKELFTTSNDFQGYSWLLIDINCSALKGVDNGLGLLYSLIEYNLRSSALTGADTLSYFSGCRRLSFVENFITSGTLTSTASMFSSCFCLKTVPLFNTASVITMANMFEMCTSLKEVPLFNMSSVTTTALMFSSCFRLKTVPLFNMSSVTTTTSMFNTCAALEFVPVFNTANALTMNSMFANCNNLSVIPNLNTNSVVSYSAIAPGQALKKCGLSKIPEGNQSFVGCLLLGRTALVEIFTALATASTTRIITITGCRGASSLTGPERAIATGKNWTITG